MVTKTQDTHTHTRRMVDGSEKGMGFGGGHYGYMRVASSSSLVHLFSGYIHSHIPPPRLSRPTAKTRRTRNEYIL